MYDDDELATFYIDIVNVFLRFNVVF